MKEQSEAIQALGRAGRRAAYHLLQAVIEGLKAVEAIIEEIGTIGDDDVPDQTKARTKIDIE